jgi:hypothetical protein
LTALRNGISGALDAQQRLAVALGGLCVAGAALAGAASVRFGPRMVGMLIVAAAFAVISYKRIELLFVGLYAVAFIGPAYLGNSAWPPVVTLVVLYIAGRELLRGGTPVLSWFLFFYSAVYALALIHGSWNPATIPAIRGIVTPALLAMATASVARDERTRRHLLLLLVPFVALQLPVALLQSLKGIGTYGQSGFEQFGDFVTGTLGSSASGTLTLVTVATATILFAAALERVWKPRLLALAAIVIAAAGVLSVARAVFIFVPVAAATTLLASAVLRKRSVGMRRIATVATLIVVATPAAVLAMSAIYPGVTRDINSVEKIREYLFLPQSGPNPERAGQLQIAVNAVKEGGAGAVLLGEGLGETWLSSDSHIVASTDTPVVLKPEQFTNSVWTPRMLVESGLLGVLAFLALLAYVLSIARRGAKRAAPRSWDSAIVLALPGLAALTFVGSFYQTVLDLPPYATIFWVMLGLGLALARAPRSIGEA